MDYTVGHISGGLQRGTTNWGVGFKYYDADGKSVAQSDRHVSAYHSQEFEIVLPQI